MKKTCSIFALILLLAMSLCTPALAASEYGVIYDETDELGSDTLTMQGEQVLPELSEKLGIDLRVDVLTQTSYDSISDTAAGIYDRYGYGYGEEQEGAMEPQDTGSYAMSDGGWCVYANLSAKRGSSRDLAAAISDAVKPSMAQRAWNGEDITMSAVALTQAVESMAQAAEDYILINCPPDTSVPAAPPETPETPEASEPDSVRMQYVFDISDLLTYEEWAELEARAADISKRQHCGVYFALVDDYTVIADDVYEATYQIYHELELGSGEDRDGIIVLLSMDNRKYAMFVYGEYAEYAFDTYGQDELEGRFLGFFGYDDWYGGITHYLDACDEFLTTADAGDPVRLSYWEYFWEYFPAVAILACLPTGSICIWLMRGMKSVRQKKEANAYLTEGGLHLTQQYDQYTHTTETRTKIQEESSSGGSTCSESGGGGSGRSGSF